MPSTGILGEAGLAKESVLGTFVAPTNYIRFLPPFQFSDDITLLESKGVSGIPDMVTKVAQGPAELKSGKVKWEVEPEGGTGEHLMAAFGSDTPTETPSYVVATGVNDTFDFNIGASQLSFAVAAGTYAAGLTQADAGTTMCKLIYNGLHAQDGAGTYTVSYSPSAKAFTITRSAGTLVLMFHTGSNTAKTIAGLIGFISTADQTSAITYTGTIPVAAAYSHAFARVASASLPSYSWWQKNGINFPEFAGCMLNKLEFDLKAKEYLVADADWMGLKYVSGGTSQAAVYSTHQPFKFDQAVVTVAGSPVVDYEELKLTIENNIELVHTVGGTIYANKIYSKGFKVSLSATITVENTTEWAKFIAGTATSFTIAITSSEMVNGAIPYSLTFVMTNVQYKAAPFPVAKDLIKITFTADAFSAVGSSTTLTATLVNSVGTSY
jgi:hypothetical protein